MSAAKGSHASLEAYALDKGQRAGNVCMCGEPDTCTSGLAHTYNRKRLAGPRDVFCPTCAAPAGVRCLTSTGKRVHGPHAAREDAFIGLRDDVLKLRGSPSWCGNPAHFSEPHIDNGECGKGKAS